MKQETRVANAVNYYWKKGLICFPVKLVLVQQKKKLINPYQWQRKKLSNEIALSMVPGKNGVAVVTGKESNLFVLDIDTEQGFHTLDDHGIIIPENVPTVRTQSGGVHYYFKFPTGLDGLKTTKAFKTEYGFDIRGDGGLIFAPPTKITDENEYSFAKKLNGKLPEMPPNLTNFLKGILTPTPAQITAHGAAQRTTGNDYDLVPDAVSYLQNRIDNYDDWVRAGMAISSMGEQGRGFWHQLSTNPRNDCTRDELDSKYNNFLKTTQRIEISTLFYMAQSHGWKHPGKQPIFTAPSIADGTPGTDGKQIQSMQPTDFKLTDMGNAERFTTLFGNKLRYDTKNRTWHFWDGKQWVPDEKGFHIELAKETIRKIYVDAAETENQELRTRIASHAQKSESAQRINSMITLAESDQLVTITPAELDANQSLFNLQNGTFNLESMNLQPFSQDDHITKIAGTYFSRDAAAPNWESFLHRIFAGDQSIIDFIARAVGYSLTGSTAEQCFFLLFGTGANGKSTFLNAIMAVFGDYAKQTPFDSILAKRNGEGPRNDLAALRGARLVSASEGDAGRRMAESTIKSLTGGDRITVRKLYGEFFEYTPTYKIWLATNHKPIIRGNDHAIWRRVKLIPFNVTIPDHEQDKHLAEKLNSELPGILNWALNGLHDYFERGLNTPQTVETAVNQYKQEMDVFKEFIDECCIEGPTYEVKSSDLYDAYKIWIDKNGERAASHRLFSMKLQELGFNKETRRDAKYITGVGLVQK